ncbi:MAG: peptidoglycan DD-metalloendopeptidase family protein [Clostridia bacterium]|nr:peptidoglycan DD-metalloendopeptidase family protein [Clostridia bacterium]
MKKGSALRTLRFIFITVVLFVLSFSAVIVTVLNVYVPGYLAKIDGEEVGYFESPAEFDEIYEKLVEEKKADGLEVEVYLASEPEFELKYVRDSVTEEQNLYTNVRAFVKTEYTVYNVEVKGKTEMTFATEKEANDYAKKIKSAVKSTVKSTVKVTKSTTEELVKTTEKASAKKIYNDLVSRYKPVVRTYSSGTTWSGTTSNKGKAPGSLHTFISGGRRPTIGIVTQGYGVYNYALYGNSMHTGIDIADNSKPNIYPYKAGTVVKVVYGNTGYGYYVIVSHGKDENGNELQTLYAHMSKINVSVGQQVTQSTALGRMGTTGLSTGIHLHFEIRVLNGSKMTRYNPAYYI